MGPAHRAPRSASAAARPIIAPSHCGTLLDKQRNGLYHDHRFLTLDSVVKHYDAYLKLNLSAEQKRQLVEYLKTL